MSAKKRVKSSQRAVKRNHVQKKVKAAHSQKRAPKQKPKRAGSRSPKPHSKTIKSQRKITKSPQTPSKSLTTAWGSESDFILPELPAKIKRPKRNEFIVPLNCEKETAVPIRNLDGDVMAGVLHEPAKPNRTLIIAIHGFLATKEQTLIKHTCIELSRAGYNAFRIDLSGHGDSEGRFEDATPRKMLRDIHAVIEHFRKRYNKIILFGHSLGATLSIITASRVKVDGIIAVAPFAHPSLFANKLTPQQTRELLSVGFTIINVKKAVGEIPHTITERFVSEVRQLNPIEATHEVHCPVLLAHGSGDTTVPSDHSEDLFNALFAKEISLIGGADHNFTNPQHLDALIGRVVEWLEKV